jgi:5-methyltetrahydropteroyltriglutamate--homocysteine methyltransferase
VDVVVDGEQRRDNFCSFVTDKLDVRLMSLAEILDTLDDKSSFEEMLTWTCRLGHQNPTCVGKLSA